MEAFSAGFNPLKTHWCSFSWTVWGWNQSSRLQQPISAADVRGEAVQGAASSVTWQQTEMPPAHPASAMQAGEHSSGQQCGVTSTPLTAMELQALQETKGAPSQPHSNPSLPCLPLTPHTLFLPCLSHISLTSYMAKIPWLWQCWHF